MNGICPNCGKEVPFVYINSGTGERVTYCEVSPHPVDGTMNISKILCGVRRVYSPHECREK